jgi:phosphoenolpyruvate carboxykinase (GTP)
VPKGDDLDLTGLDISEEQLAKATRIDLAEWERELTSSLEFFDKLGPTVPEPLVLQAKILLARVREGHAKA